MPNRPALFKQVDVTRAVKGYLAAGLSVGAVRIEQDGAITVTTLGNSDNSGDIKNDWDRP